MEQKQILNSNQGNVTNMIDEYFNPRHLQEKTHLSDLVEEDMVAQGYDPLNKEDVQMYWKSKGVTVNG